MNSILRTLTNIMIKLFSLNRPGKVKTSIYQRIRPVEQINKGNINLRMACPNQLIRTRIRTFFTKEPDTISWIEGFKKEEVLFDIGANIGIFSLYAASHGVRVYAFEPESKNYAVLNENINLNVLDKTITAFPLAVANSMNLDELHLRHFEAGAAGNGFDEPIDQYRKERFNPVFSQGSFSLSIDHITDKFLTCPDHIKIDVDGIEYEIIKGASKTLENPKLKSILVELSIHSEKDMKVVDIICSKGFELKTKVPTTKNSRGIHNYIFSRTT